jgi:biopolymer transport protein ExbD
MSKEITEEEKTLLVESKLRTCELMQQALESYVLEETDPDVVRQYQDSIEEYKNIIEVLKVFKETR